MSPSLLEPPRPILPARPGTGPHAGLAQLKAKPGEMPRPILPGRPGVRSEVGQPQAMPQPILPARNSTRPDVGQPQSLPQPILPARMGAGAGGRAGVIQGAFPGGRPRVPVRAPRPGQKGTFQLKPAAPMGNATPLPDDFAGARSFSPGKRMPQTIQARMESVFGTSFGDVRIHEGPEAASIGAFAFTQGSSIFFAPGQYNPNTPGGQRLLGQQLAHVVQQRSGRVRNPFGAGMAVVHDPLLKAEAEMMGSRAAMAQTLQPKSLNGQQQGPGPQRQTPAAILPKKPGAVAASAPGSVAAAPRAILPSAPAPILPRRADGGVSGTPATRSNPATSHGAPILPGNPVQAKLAPAPILPGRPSSASGAVGLVVQPLMALGAVVARGLELFTSVVTQVGRRVFGL